MDEEAVSSMASRASSDTMDLQRQEQVAYEYLCHLEETRAWLSACISQELPGPSALEESLRNGVYLAKLAHFFAPDVVPLRKVYDADESVYAERGLRFRHTDNINHWLAAMRAVGLPQHFFPDAFDLYEKRNLPKVIYCLHALSLLLFKLGKAPKIEDLVGKLSFSSSQIDEVRLALQERGVELPAFGKIGGILAREMSADDAALHVAVILINKALDDEDPEAMVAALRDPRAELCAVRDTNASRYLQVLRVAKQVKLENHLERSLDGSYVADVYDEMLNQAEIQGYVFETNVNVLLEQLDKAIKEDDLEVFGTLIGSPDLGVSNVVPENVAGYLEVLKKIRKDADDEAFVLSKSDLQVAVTASNEKVDLENAQEEAIIAINNCLKGDDAEATFRALQNPAAALPEVYPLVSGLYHSELASIRNEAGHNLDRNELINGLCILSAIAEVNFSLRMKGSCDVVESLRKPSAHISGVNEGRTSRYMGTLLQELSNKSKGDSVGTYLTHTEIQNCVDIANSRADDEHDKEKAVQWINQAVASGNASKTVDALLKKAAMILCVDKAQEKVYQLFLATKQAGQENAFLTVDDIQHEVNSANTIATESNRICVSLATVHMGVVHGSADDVLNGLEALDSVKVIPGCKKLYLKELQRLSTESKNSEEPLEWLSCFVQPNLHFNFNLLTLQSEWSDSPYGSLDSYMSLDKVTKLVEDVNNRFLSEDFIPLWVNFQAVSRGWLARRPADELRKRLARIISFRIDTTDSQQVRASPLKLRRSNSFLARLQSHIRGFLTRRRLHISICHPEVEKESCQELLNQAHLPLIREFLHSLDVSAHDFSQEAELQKVKSSVVASIRHNNALEKEVDAMDVKIGLLVRNCITLGQVMQHTGKKAKRDSLLYQTSWLKTTQSLTSLSKESRERLAAYQHLFYLLQTDPTYLAKLIFAMPASRSNKFIESVIPSIFNYGSSPREEYLLLMLFKSALEEEIKLKVQNPADILTGNPLVLKMVVDFYRTGRGQGALQDLLKPLVSSVLDDPDLSIDLSPVDVYKKWINEIETTTGKPSGMKYECSAEDAIQHPEVQERLSESVVQLEKLVSTFCTTITKSQDKVPYGILYVAKVLKNSLHSKFPSLPEEELLKYVGNLLYYRYINSGIVAPDSFDIIQLSPGTTLTTKQRKNLGLIAKILQLAASGKTYDNDQHLRRLSVLTRSCNLIFQEFFREACDVTSPEEHFGIDSYTEASLLTPPTITLTLQELRDTHQLLLEHKLDVAPDSFDVLHRLLDDIGKLPTDDELLGPLGGTSSRKVENTELCLTLTRKYTDEEDKVQLLYSETKQMVVRLIRYRLDARTAREVLCSPVTEEEDQLYQSCSSPETVEARKKFQTLQDLHQMALESVKALQKVGRLPADDTYMGYLLEDIAKDIVQQREYRRSREQELRRLQQTQRDLDRKTAFYEEKLDYYQQYVQACLNNLINKGPKKGHQAPKLRTSSLKYTGAQLADKGVLLSVDGLEPSQLKNAHFELSPREQQGVFSVRARFLGVPVDAADIDIQDLLQKQYEGVAVMDVFGKARVNVNLLLYLINRKFYGK